ncbi:MAG: SPOR domain-containing protein [Bacteroidota bacterium]
MKEMRSSLFVILSIFGGTLLQAQSASRVDLLKQWQDAGEKSQVRIEVDSLLVANYYKLMVISSQVSGVPGYRIRIYSESGTGAKEEQQRERAKFLSLFPDVDAYYRYDEPYFKVYVGDCRTRSEALKLYDRIKKSFPNPILVEDFINIQ